MAASPSLAISCLTPALTSWAHVHVFFGLHGTLYAQPPFGVTCHLLFHHFQLKPSFVNNLEIPFFVKIIHQFLVFRQFSKFYFYQIILFYFYLFIFQIIIFRIFRITQNLFLIKFASTFYSASNFQIFQDLLKCFKNKQRIKFRNSK